MLPTVLKRKHSLKGKQLLPVIRKLRDIQDAHGIKQLARTSSARRTENMSNEDVLKAVEDLTGENGIELLELAGKDPNDEDFAKLLLHVCILHANEKGQPEGQDLQDPELGHSSATTADQEQPGLHVPLIQGRQQTKTRIQMGENVGSYKIQQLKSKTRMVHRFSR